MCGHWARVSKSTRGPTPIALPPYVSVPSRVPRYLGLCRTAEEQAAYLPMSLLQVPWRLVTGWKLATQRPTLSFRQQTA